MKIILWRVLWCQVLLFSALTTAEEQATEAQSKEEQGGKKLNTYFFGHSLVHHTNYKIPTPKDQTSIPYWLRKLSQTAGHRYTSDGQFGFLRNHAQLPAQAKWHFKSVPSAWAGAFGKSNYNAVILTAANFVQYQPANKGYYDDANVSPLDASLDILDYSLKEAPQAQFYLYENWPDMGEYAKNYPPKPPSASTLAKYHRYAKGEFHQWWLNYLTMINKTRPAAKVKMIPVGPILSELLTTTPVQTIPFNHLFEDNAPHGRPTTYFLAALIHYMALYQEKPPGKFEFPASIDPVVKTHYAVIVDTIWKELSAFNDAKGKSLVW